MSLIESPLSFIQRISNITNSIEKPFKEDFDHEASETVKFMEEIQSKEYIMTKNRTNLITELAGVYFIPLEGKRRNSSIIKSNYMKGNFAPKFPKYLWAKSSFGRSCLDFINSKYMCPIRLLLVNSVVFTINYTCFLLYSHDKLSVVLKATKIRESTQSLEECVQPNEVHDPPELLIEYNHVKEQLRQLGSIYVALPGVGVTVIGIVALLASAYYHLSQFMLKFRHPRIDHLNFFYDPLSERQRFKVEIWTIIKDLIDSIKDVDTANNIVSYKTSTLANEDQQELKEKSCRVFTQNSRLLQLLIEIRNKNLVRPVIITSMWHRNLTFIYNFMMIFGQWSIFMSTIFTTISLVSLEIFVKTRHRLSKFKCRKWNPNAILLYDFVQLEELTHIEHFEAYKDYDESLSYLLYLAIYIESRYYFNFKKFKFLIVYIVLLLFNSATSASFGTIYIFSAVDKLMWISQLELQIKLCLGQLDKFDELARGGEGTQYYHSNTVEKELLDKSILITYINYELFRRQHRLFLPMMNFYLVQALTLAIFGLLIYFFFSTGVEIKNLTPILGIVALIIMTVNIYLVGASYVAARIHRIIKQIDYLLAKLSTCNDGRMSLDYTVEIWRRQMLSKKDVQFYFSPRLFEFHITYDHTLSINAQAIAAALLLLRVKVNNNDNNITSKGITMNSNSSLV